LGRLDPSIISEILIRKSEEANHRGIQSFRQGSGEDPNHGCFSEHATVREQVRLMCCHQKNAVVGI
jgi:hypothetical protein